MQLWNLISENKHISFRMTEQFDGIPTWNAELEILYVLKGSELTCGMNGKTYILAQEDFIVFNPYEIHCINGKDCMVLSLFVFPTLLALKSSKRGEGRIECCSTSTAAPGECYEEIRRLMANSLLIFYKETQSSEYQIYSCVLDILSIFEENFLIKIDAPLGKEQSVAEHMQKIVRYMDENYMEDISLARVAKLEFISANYLSHLFRSYLHTSFVKYLRMLRLNHAYSDLLNTDLVITDIALKNGFGNSTAFIRYFKDMYGKTPAKFRKSLETQSYYQHNPQIEDEKIFFALARHATDVGQTMSLLRKNVETRRVDANCREKGWLRPQSWNELMNVGWAKEAMLAPIQQQVLRAKCELGIRTIRFHGIFDHDMYIYNQEENGDVFYNFGYLDMLLDFLISNELVPFIEFGFVPQKLASNEDRYYDHYSSICLPNNLERWSELVKSTLQHCISRYGVQQVSGWRFTVFNSVYVYYGCISEEDWWALWQATYYAVKTVNPQFAFGLNDDIGLFGPTYTRFWKYIVRAKKEECLPDFISLQCFYGDYYASGKLAFGKVYSQKEMPLPHSADENYLPHKLDYLDGQMKQYGVYNIPIVFEAWNSTVWQRDSCNDGCFKSAFLIKNILENEDRLQALGHWTLSDFMEEVPHNPEIFHGGYGILTYNGIPKPGYYAMQMLQLLGEHCINRGNGWYITCAGEDIQVLLYHYYHYDLLYQRHYTVKSDSMFKFQNSISFDVRLSGLPAGEYNFTIQKINQESGSSYDIWLGMGAPQHPTFDQIEYIKQISRPELKTYSKSVADEYRFVAHLRAHEVQLITIHRLH